MHPPRGPWEFPVGFSVVPSGFPRFFSGKPHRFPAIFPADASKRQENFPLGFRPSICRFQSGSSALDWRNHTVSPNFLFITFNKTAPISLRNFVGFSRIPTVCLAGPAKPLPTHCMIYCFFTPGAVLPAGFASVLIPIVRTLLPGFLVLVGLLPDATAPSGSFFPGGAAPFGAGFMAKSFHLKYSSLKLSLSGGHFFLRFTLFLLSCHILLAYSRTPIPP